MNRNIVKAYAKRAVCIGVLFVLKLDSSEGARKDERYYQDKKKEHEATIRAARKK